MYTSVSLTDAARLPVAHFQELVHSLTKHVGCRQIRSISTPSLPLHRASWKHIPGIIYCEHMDPVVPCPISSDQERDIRVNFFRQHLVVGLP